MTMPTFLGLSLGVNLAGAVRYAQATGPGQAIVSILCGSGLKNQSKLYNVTWLKRHDLDPDLPLESIETSLNDEWVA